MNAAICKCHSLARFTMTPAEKKRCRTTCQGASFIARVAMSALLVIEHDARELKEQGESVGHIDVLAADALRVLAEASCSKCMAVAA